MYRQCHINSSKNNNNTPPKYKRQERQKQKLMNGMGKQEQIKLKNKSKTIFWNGYMNNKHQLALFQKGERENKYTEVKTMKKGIIKDTDDIKGITLFNSTHIN